MLRAAYYATVSYLDALIGQIFSALDESGQANPEEARNLAEDPEYAHVLSRMMGLLRERVDPETVDALAKSAQSALITQQGGTAEVLRKMGGCSYSLQAFRGLAPRRSKTPGLE